MVRPSPQHDTLWCDELAAWHGKRHDAGEMSGPQAAWDMAMFGLRVGAHPQVMITSTPRPISIIRELMRSPDCKTSRSTTYENIPYLAGKETVVVRLRHTGSRFHLKVRRK